MTSVYTEAVRRGYIYRYGHGKPSADGKTWLSRFQKSPEEDSRPVLYLGYDPDQRCWVEEELLC